MIRLINIDEEVIRIIPRENCMSALHTQHITDEKYLSEQLNLQTLLLDDEVISDTEYLAIPVEGEPYLYHFFWVKDVKSDDNFTYFQGVLAGIEELSKTPVIDVRPQNRSLRDAVTQLLDGSNYIPRYVANTGLKSDNVYFKSIWDGLKSYCLTWNVEMQLFVEITDSGVGARYIDFRERIGVNRGTRVAYGHNALEIIKEVERVEIYTALIGRGNGEQVGETEEGIATYGRKINFSDVEWKTTNGDPVNKPAGQYYVELPEATQLYGIKTGEILRPKIGFIDFNTDDEEELLQLTYEALIEVARPKRMFRTSAIYLDGEIGETVRVVNADRGIDYDTRIFELTIERINNTIIDIKLGDRLIESQSARERRITNSATVKAVEEINYNLGETLEDSVKFVISANGLNRNFYGALNPIEDGYTPFLNDTWFKPDPNSEGDTIVYIWNGSVWQEVLRSFDDTQVQDLISKYNELKDQIDAGVEVTIEDVKEALDGAEQIDLDHIFARLISDGKFETLFYQNARSIGMVYDDGVNDKQSLIVIQDGIPLIKGEHVILDGNTVVDGKFTVTGDMLAKDAVIKQLKADGIDAKDVKIINLDFQSMAGSNIELTDNISITHNGKPILYVDANGTFKFDATAAGVATKEYTDSEITKSNMYTDKAVGDIRVGGENLIPSASLSSVMINEPKPTTKSFSGVFWAHQILDNNWVREYLKPDTEYTISYKAKVTELNTTTPINPQTVYALYLYNQKPEFPSIFMGQGNRVEYNSTKEVGKVYEVVNTFRTPKELHDDIGYRVLAYTAIDDTSIPVRLRDEIEFIDLILVEGNVAPRGHTFSPQDTRQEIEDRIGDVQTYIDDIQTSVSDFESILLDRATKGELDDAVEKFLKSVETESKARDEALKNMEGILNRIPAMQQTLGAMSAKWDFINSSITFAEEGIFVHRGESGILISPNRIDLKNDGETTMYISENQLHINRGLFVESLGIGVHVFQKASDEMTFVGYQGG